MKTEKKIKKRSVVVKKQYMKNKKQKKVKSEDHYELNKAVNHNKFEFGITVN